MRDLKSEVTHAYFGGTVVIKSDYCWIEYGFWLFIFFRHLMGSAYYILHCRHHTREQRMREIKKVILLPVGSSVCVCQCVSECTYNIHNSQCILYCVCECVQMNSRFEIRCDACEICRQTPLDVGDIYSTYNGTCINAMANILSFGRGSYGLSGYSDLHIFMRHGVCRRSSVTITYSQAQHTMPCIVHA